MRRVGAGSRYVGGGPAGNNLPPGAAAMLSRLNPMLPAQPGRSQAPGIPGPLDVATTSTDGLLGTLQEVNSLSSFGSSDNEVVDVTHQVIPLVEAGMPQRFPVGMLVFTARRTSAQTNALVDMTLPVLNQYFEETYTAHLSAILERNSDHIRFAQCMEQFGTEILFQLDHAYGSRTDGFGSHIEIAKLFEGRFTDAISVSAKDVGPELKWYYDRSKTVDFSYLTKFGILNRINYVGIVLSDQSLQAPYDEDKSYRRSVYNNTGRVALAVAKNAETKAIFRGSCTGVKTPLYIVLTRHRNPANKEYTHFEAVPVADENMEDYEYRDQSGAAVPCHRWFVGHTRWPSKENPNQALLDSACNLGVNKNAAYAHEQFLRLPILRIVQA